MDQKTEAGDKEERVEKRGEVVGVGLVARLLGRVLVVKVVRLKEVRGAPALTMPLVARPRAGVAHSARLALQRVAGAFGGVPMLLAVRLVFAAVARRLRRA